MFDVSSKYEYIIVDVNRGYMSQGLLGLCCSIETRDCMERITLTADLFE